MDLDLNKETKIFNTRVNPQASMFQSFNVRGYRKTLAGGLKYDDPSAKFRHVMFVLQFSPKTRSRTSLKLIKRTDLCLAGYPRSSRCFKPDLLQRRTGKIWTNIICNYRIYKI